MTGFAVRVPASSANMGPGFDVLGIALELYADVGTGDAPDGAQVCDDHHPATVAFRELRGEGPLWVRTSIPMSRGLGYSGAVRVGGAALAVVQASSGTSARDLREHDSIRSVATRLEGHGDNVLASLWGGVTVHSDDVRVRVELGFDTEPVVVVWSPASTTTSTDRSRRSLPAMVPLADASYNIAHAAALVIGLERGDVSMVGRAVDDRLHQRARLEALPVSAAALGHGTDAGAWCGWLSGSGPTVAFLCAPDRAPVVAAAMPGDGRVRVLGIDHLGARVLSSENATGKSQEPEQRT